ncbi:hypothetical protein [Lachnotalea glycerini]|nr:hypothetical protein [Lachnotalea glycerini]
MAKKISFGLSVSEVNKAIQEVEAYKKELNNKVQIFARRLSEFGLITARAIIQSHTASGSTIGSLRVVTDSTGQITRMRVVVESEAILFLEFGAGITYNQGNENPKAGKLGYGVGTYPDQTHAYDPNGWWYQDENGEWKHSYGTKAVMPMYTASLVMASSVVKIAREVFKS